MKTKAVKYDHKKIRTDLLSTVAMEEIAKVLTFGAEKYSAHNWRSGFVWSRLIGASLRHLYAFMRGEDYDAETGLSHVAHLSCCAMFLLEHQLVGFGVDDRWNEYGNVPQAKSSVPARTRVKRGKKRKK